MGADEPVVIEADPAEAASAARGIVVLTAVAFAVLFAWIAISEPVLVVLAPVAGLGVWWWARSVERAEPVPTRLVVGRDLLAFSSGGSHQEVARPDAGAVEVESRWLGRTAGTWPVLVVRDRTGATVLEVTLWDEPATTAALRARGWLD